ncbi:type II toxin-antitoxin system YafO family toxin [Cronobacter turicensis]
MSQNEYQGGVFSESIFKSDSRLVDIRKSFISHWRYGHHPDFGKDTLFHKPQSVYPIHLRKVHVNLGLYTNAYGFSGSEECWNDWASGRFYPNGREKTVPTSDAYLIYAVCESRNAALLEFWFPPAHKKAELNSMVEVAVGLADVFHAKTKFKPMPRDVHPWEPSFLTKKPA